MKGIPWKTCLWLMRKTEKSEGYTSPSEKHEQTESVIDDRKRECRYIWMQRWIAWRVECRFGGGNNYLTCYMS